MIVFSRWSRLAKCSVMLGDTVTARHAMQCAGGTDTDQEKRNLDFLERFKEETMNSLNTKDHRRVSGFLVSSILK